MRMVKWSSSSMPAPSSASSRSVVLTSCRLGTLWTTSGSSPSRPAHRIGSTAFLAPEIRTSPRRGTPPPTTIFCMSGARFLGGQGAQRQGMDLAAHAFAEDRVDLAVPGQWQLAAERLAHHDRLEVHAVGALHGHRGTGEALFDQLLDGFGVHRGEGANSRKIRAPVYPKAKPPECRPRRSRKSSTSPPAAAACSRSRP